LLELLKRELVRNNHFLFLILILKRQVESSITFILSRPRDLLIRIARLGEE